MARPDPALLPVGQNLTTGGAFGRADERNHEWQARLQDSRPPFKSETCR